MEKFFKHYSLNSFWKEVFGFCFVLGLYLFLIIDTNYTNVLYLCGDVTREAYRTYGFLQSGSINHNYSYPFEADTFCLGFLPFLILFKNSILAIQLAGIALGVVTVTVLYLFIRRTYGLLAALAIGSTYSVSPLLLGHSMLSPIFEVPLWIGIILLLETFKGKTVTYISIFSAGVFTAFSPYFIFPYFGYIAGITYHRNLISRINYRKTLLFLSLYLLGWLLFSLPKLFSNPGYLSDTTLFVNSLLTANIARAHDIFAVINNFGVQLSWSLDSTIRYGASKDLALTTWPVYLWGVSMFISALFKDSRRWVITIACGFIPACFISSYGPAGGIGMRHFLAFMPFYWLILAPLISRIAWLKGKPFFCVIALAVVTGYFSLARAALIIPQNIFFAEVIIRDAEYMKQFFSQCPRKYIFISEYDSNLYSGLTYFIPEKKITSVSTVKQGERGIIYLCRRFDPDHIKDHKYYHLGYIHAIGGGGQAYAVRYEL